MLASTSERTKLILDARQMPSNAVAASSTNQAQTHVIKGTKKNHERQRHAPYLLFQNQRVARYTAAVDELHLQVSSRSLQCIALPRQLDRRSRQILLRAMAPLPSQSVIRGGEATARAANAVANLSLELHQPGLRLAGVQGADFCHQRCRYTSVKQVIFVLPISGGHRHEAAHDQESEQRTFDRRTHSGQ